MPNLESLYKAIPVAPLKIAALESSLPFAMQVHRHLLEYRHKTPTHDIQDIAFKGYLEDNYLLDCSCPRFGSGEAKALSGIMSGAVIYLSLWTYAITV